MTYFGALILGHITTFLTFWYMFLESIDLYIDPDLEFNQISLDLDLELIVFLK